jgi:iron-sulfur cluster assembly accessory protein
MINITKSAWKKLIHISSKSNNKSFLFGINSGGCNGFNFDLNKMKNDDFNRRKKLKPNYLENEGIKVYIDPIAEIYLLGTTIDYITQDYEKNIFESKFEFIIDKKLASTCGCGISFTPNNL